MDLNYPRHLPISDKKADIIQALKKHQIVVIAGDTGSGKTTQLPKMCIEAGLCRKGIIGCTQPRRIAAISVADRVNEELGDSHIVGSKVRFHDKTSDITKIKFMTDGILLAETRSDRLLQQYDVIIIDEAHERSLNIDFLLGYLHQLCARRKDVTLVISSATIDTDKFSRHFNNAPIIEVSGRTYPITYHYQDDGSEEQTRDQTVVEQAVKQTCLLADQGEPGDILVFMPTERDIMDTVSLLNKKLQRQALVLPLFGRLHGKEQRKIFHPSPLRKIIVATNVAETSITVPGILSVIDTGLARIAHYNSRTGTTSLPVTKIARASCDQRAGRCGRTGPGTCIRLYSEDDYMSRAPFTLPELLRSNLAEVILQMISLNLGDPRKFPFIDPPSSRAIHDGYRTLKELGAISGGNKLTKRGRIMAKLPLDPRVSRMIIEGAELGALREVIVIAAVLSIQDPRIRPVEQLEKARQAQQIFIEPGSDVITFINIWDRCKDAMSGQHPAAGLKKFCKTYFCSWQRMREWFDIHDQILRIITSHTHFSINSEPASPAAVHRALTAGFLRNIGLRKEKNRYQVSGNREVILFPGSGLHNKGGQWIVAADFVHTSQLFARTVANIDVKWLETLGGHLCKRSWSDPGWQKKTGQVTALEKVTLFGLVIVAGRRVNYGQINKTTASEARSIFIQEALVHGNLRANYPFLRHNLDFVQHLTELEERLRKRGILMEEQVLYDFYDQRLGLVYDRYTLKTFLKKHKTDSFLWMTQQDICQDTPNDHDLYRFPKTIQTSQGKLRLSYCFQPGHPDDGVTVHIPVDYYSALDPALFEWLVPGLLEEKILFLLKGLPKKLRKQFVPLPNTVDKLMDGLTLYKGSLYEQLERLILRQFQIRMSRNDWQLDNLPPHLRMGFQLFDHAGKTLHTGKSFHELEQYTLTVFPGRKSQIKTPERPKTITTWDFKNAPSPVPALDDQQRITSITYPAICVSKNNQTLTLEYIQDAEQARRQNQQGLRILYAKEFSKELKAIRNECKKAVKNHSASWLSLGMHARAAEITDVLLASIIDNIFSLFDSDLPDKKQFQKTVKEVRETGITSRGIACLDQIIAVLATRRQVQTKLLQYRQRAVAGKNFDQRLFDEFQSLLNELVPATFLESLQEHDCNDTRRYLMALAKRIERAEYSPQKDYKKATLLKPALQRLEQFKCPGRPSRKCRQEIAIYKRMIEELRVSIFAPELGTATPVSNKRLQRQWLQLENECLVVE